MKIVIAGCGKVGAVLADQLSSINHDVIVIDIEEENLFYVENSLDVMCVTGNAASVSVLNEVGIDKCDLLIAMTGSDELNLVICLTAKKLGVANTIARVRNPIYAESIDIIKEDTGLSMAVNPEYEAAQEIFRSLRFKSAGQVEAVANSSVEVITCTINQKTPLCGIEIKDLYKVAGARIFACAIKRGSEVFIPNAQTKFMDGDVLSFVASPEDTFTFFNKMGYDTRKINNMVIIGAGRLGYYLGKLCLENGIPVKFIEKNRETCKKIDIELPGSEVIYGSGTDIDLYEEENIYNANAIASVTGVDETNMLISMYLKTNAPNAKIITKIKKSDFEEIMHNVNIGNVFYPKYITADQILKYVCAMDNSKSDEIQSLYHVIDNKVEVLEILVKETHPHRGIALKDLRLKNNLLIANISRAGDSFIPGGEDTMEAGDTLLIVTTRNDIGKFVDIFA